MATSGSVNFTQTRNEIITGALELIGVSGIGRTVSSEDMALASSSLNLMVKSWQAQGLHLWTKEEGVLFAATNTGEYKLNNTSSDARATNWSDAVLTLLDGALAASATAVTTDTTVGMAVADIIGIIQTDGTLHWDTIASVPTSTTLTLTTGLTSAASNNANVYTFTNRVNKPLKIHSMRRVRGIDSTSTDGSSIAIPMIKLSHSDFYDLPSLGSNGNSTHFHYDPDLLDGTVYLWPRPDSPTLYFRFTYTRMLENFDSSTDNADFPVEWLEAIKYQLALRIAPPFGKESKVSALVLSMAQDLLQQMKDWDTEVVSIYLMPDKDYE